MKRMLAYSSVSQIGYIIMGLSLANPWGFAGALLHVLNHAVMKACLFMIAGQLRLKEGHSDISRFDDSYRKKYPWTMASFSVAAISMIGLPPLAGFFSKWYLALGTIDNSNWLFLAVILISSLLNAVYFFRVLEKVYMMDPSKDKKSLKDGRNIMNQKPACLIPTSLFLAVSLIVIGFANASDRGCAAEYFSDVMKLLGLLTIISPHQRGLDNRAMSDVIRGVYPVKARSHNQEHPPDQSLFALDLPPSKGDLLKIDFLLKKTSTKTFKP
jgi:formate hydrogenlyase subunit 3/multisubunit Na+/H+ antiporter MnhD subunit